MTRDEAAKALLDFIGAVDLESPANVCCDTPYLTDCVEELHGLSQGGTASYWRGFHEGQRKAAELLMSTLSEDPISAMAHLDQIQGHTPESEPIGAGTAAGILQVARAILGLRGRGRK